MAEYTTVDKMKLRIDPTFLAELADDINADADIDDTKVVEIIKRAIQDASNDIDSYLFGELDMTVADNLTMVEPKCADMALYRLYKRRHYSGDDNPAQEDNRRAFGWLRDVQKGLLRTDDDPLRQGSLISTSSDIDDRIFDTDTLANF